MAQNLVGRLSGKFTKSITPLLYRFAGDGGNCFISFKYPPKTINFSSRVTILVKLKGQLMGEKRYSFHKFLNAGGIQARKLHASKRLREMSELAAVQQAAGAVAFSTKSRGAGSSAVTPNRKYMEKAAKTLFKHTRELNKLLQPTQEELVAARHEREYWAAIERQKEMERADAIAAEDERQKKIFQNKKLMVHIREKYKLKQNEMRALRNEWAFVDEKHLYADSLEVYADSLFSDRLTKKKGVQ